MFDIKICGIRHLVDVQAVVTSGADAIGLNFFKESIRYVDPRSPQTAQLARTAQSSSLFCVGVFVNETAETLAGIAETVGLDGIQLHGDEELELIGELKSQTTAKLIRAIKLPVGPIDASEIASRVDPWVEAGCHPLLDADAGASHGGGGKTLDWPSIETWAEQMTTPWTLAGGLNVENVGEAMVETGARSVDVASGVEEERGRKSEWMIRRFVAEARAAMEI